MTVSRGWTWLDSVGEEKMEDPILQAEIEQLMARRNALATEIENEGFMRQSYLEETGYYPGEDDEEIGPEVTARRNISDQLKHAEIEQIDKMLAERGARVMRPYEHYNEEERLMEYLERDR